eukprot:6698686-Pyramimonas_sp.AAC.1
MKTTRPQAVNSCKCVKRTCAALRREPHVEHHPPCICETAKLQCQAKRPARPKNWPRGATGRSFL